MKNNKKIEELKQNYNNIEIPDRLDYVINDALSINKHKKSRIAKWSIVAASLCIVIGVVNLSPAFASTLESIPLIGNVIKIINFKNYRLNENGYDILLMYQR